MKYSSKLNEFDILDLLNEYHSELRKLKHKVDFVKDKVADLEAQYSTIKRIKAAATANVKAETAPSSEQQPAESSIVQSEKKSRKPYPLSDWDKFILQTIEETNRATLSKEIYDSVKEKAVAAGIFTTDDKSKSKINQCLVKLTNRREDIRKVNHKGRGFAYALPQWYDERNRLKKEYRLK
ncbi:MAG: hypothetical protein KJ578_04975 [Bacteroidetes bacterium]|nr:hypothetical protein [Bacteroidota bacterium]MBU1580437.1 hypothetical protein [Bacteroidota bacterium]MBU2466541.1 hypothetical protein [Bacteroidota bacterium]MBU2557116.1 hypothetical protein [Bacteroidota bacterium]